MKLLYKPLRLVVGILGGIVARAIFKQVWKLSTGQEEAPKPTDARRSWREILIAAAVQGSIFAVVKAALDRATAQGTGQLTGDDADEPVSAGA